MLYQRLACILVILSLAAPATPVVASMSHVYISQVAKGGNTGRDCANALGSTFFNTAGNWGSGASQIGPGTTVHICGTWTGEAGAQFLRFQKGGLPGSVITLLFEPGAVMQAPYFAFGSSGSPSGAIDINSRSHLLIDGGTTCGIENRVVIELNRCNGIIRNTDNGTNLTYQADSVGVYSSGSPSDIEIRNLVISVYARIDSHNNAHAPDGVKTYGIYFDHSGPTKLLVHHNNVQHAARGIMLNFEGRNASNIQFYNNYVADIGWGLTIGGYGANTFATSVKIFNNEVTDWDNWVSPSGAFHSNGIFTFHNCPNGEICFVGSADSYIYNNYIHGDLNGNFSGASASGFIQASSASQFTIFNNHIVGSVTAGSFGIGNGIYLLGCATKSPTFCGGGIRIYNNTIDFSGANGNCISVATLTANTIRNNIMANGCNGLVNSYQAGFSLMDSNYNVGHLLRGNHWACDMTNPCKTLADIQFYGIDLSSTDRDPLLVANGQLRAGSAAIGSGVNLTNLGIAELNKDANGAPRPSTGPWEIGAFEFISAGDLAPPPPINLRIQ